MWFHLENHYKFTKFTINDTDPIIVDENKRRNCFKIADAETQKPSVALSPFMNILNALLQWHQGIKDKKDIQLIFLWGLGPQDHSVGLKAWTCSCEIRQMEAHQTPA